MRDKHFPIGALGNSCECIYVVSPRQRIVLWNTGAARKTGYSSAEVLGRHCYQVIGGMRGDKAYCHAGCPMHRAVSRGVLPESVKLRITTKTGARLYMMTSFIILESAEGPLTVHILRDVSSSERRDAALERILAELQRAGLSDRRADPSASEARDSNPENPRARFLTQLTRREIEILTLLSEGVSTKAIAERLSVSVHTVRSHIEHALLKSGLHSRTEAVAAAFRAGLLSLR